VAVVYIIIKVLDKLITTSKESREAIADATEEYENQKQALDDLNDSLDETKEKIAELQEQSDKGTLSLVDKEELE
jgi:methyl-accepting chemotaxis protein